MNLFAEMNCEVEKPPNPPLLRSSKASKLSFLNALLKTSSLSLLSMVKI